MEGNSHMFGLYAWMYEQESQRISDRVKVAYLNDARRSNFRGSVAPYGYSVNDKRLCLRDDYTHEVVKRIFREYLEGAGCDSIAKGLYIDYRWLSYTCSNGGQEKCI
jgi:site-specific DNA recombinase